MRQLVEVEVDKFFECLLLTCEQGDRVFDKKPQTGGYRFNGIEFHWDVAKNKKNSDIGITGFGEGYRFNGAEFLCGVIRNDKSFYKTTFFDGSISKEIGYH
jgi:hypothetical protein